jgi:hypothetical protein
MLPLWTDLQMQMPRLRRFVVEFALFVCLLLVLDRALAAVLLRGLERYYGLNKPAEVLLLGHSHTVLGIDKPGLERATGRSVANYARAGADTFNRLEMLRHYLGRQPDTVKVVVYDVDAHAFTGKGLSANSYRLFFPFIDTPSVDAYVRREATSVGEYVLRRYFKTSRFSEETVASSIRGWLGKWTNLKRGTVDIAGLEKSIAAGDVRRITFDSENVAAFEQIIKEIRSRGIQLVLLYIPTVDVFNAVEPEKYAEAIRRFESYAAADPGVTFLNYNLDLASRHELFYDPIHMNPAGQKVVTERLIVDLEAILSRQPKYGN